MRGDQVADPAADPGGEIRALLEPALRADPGVIAAFAGARVRIYNLSPPAGPESLFPYIAIGLGQVIPEQYDRIDVGEYIGQLHAWDRPTPRSTDRAGAIAAAALRVCLTLTGGSTANFALGEVTKLPTRILEDPDGMSIHAVAEASIPYDLA